MVVMIKSEVHLDILHVTEMEIWLARLLKGPVNCKMKLKVKSNAAGDLTVCFHRVELQ